MNEPRGKALRRLFDPDLRLGRFLADQRKKLLSLSQAEFAKRLGVTRVYLANVETGRTPLKVKTAWYACRLLNKHPDFLISCGGRGDAPFPVFDDRVGLLVEAAMAAHRQTNFIDAWGSLRDILLNLTEGPIAPDAKPGEKAWLTYMPSLGKMSSVKANPWQHLKRRLQSATSKTGKKSELAEHLGVDLTSVSRWIRDGSTLQPGADYTLSMLKWVQEQEKEQ